MYKKIFNFVLERFIIKTIFLFTFLLVSMSLFAQEKPEIVDWYQSNKNLEYMQFWDEAVREQVRLEPNSVKAEMYRFIWCVILIDKGENIPSSSNDIQEYYYSTSSGFNMAFGIYKTASITGLTVWDVLINAGRHTPEIIDFTTRTKNLYDWSRTNRLFVY
jgi:hypothetical protein